LVHLTTAAIDNGTIDNHKPNLSSDTAPNTAKIKTGSGSGTYNLSFTDNGGGYAYSGSRSSKEGQFVLIFDPARQAFVLHRVDSLFSMNISQTPATNDAAKLEREFPHLDTLSIRGNADGGAPSSSSAGKKADKKADKKASFERAAPKAAAKKKAEKKEAPAPLSLPPPAPEPPKPEKKKKRRPVESDTEESDASGDGLEIEWNGANTVAPPSTGRRNDFSPAFPTPVKVRRFSEFQREEDGSPGEDADADGEDDLDLGGYDLDDDEDRNLPPLHLGSPVTQQPAAAAPVGDEDEDDELAREFMDDEDESEVSEEE
jgi:hypothetical protein